MKLDGTSNSKSSRPKQRYRCRAPDGGSHTFVGVLPRDRASGGKPCPTCGNVADRSQGPVTLPGSPYHVREVVQALLDVASGISYTEATRRARTRYLGGVDGYGGDGDQSGSTVANWVDLYAPILLDRLLPASWPVGVGLDSTEFMYTNTRTGERSQLFTILAAVGYEPGARGRLWALHAFPTDSSASWQSVLRSCTGRPAWAVYDGDKAIKAAVGKLWVPRKPPTVLYWSEHHLYKNALAALKADGSGGYGTELSDLLRVAFQTATGWEAFRCAVTAADLPTATRWVISKDREVRAQLQVRGEVGKYSTGGVEPVLDVVKEELRTRSWTFRNVVRMNLLLGLLQLRINRVDNAYDWTRILTDALYGNAGKSSSSYNRDGTDLLGNRVHSLRAH